MEQAVGDGANRVTGCEGRRDASAEIDAPETASASPAARRGGLRRGRQVAP
jgi:hypothetical protein